MTGRPPVTGNRCRGSPFSPNRTRPQSERRARPRRLLSEQERLAARDCSATISRAVISRAKSFDVAKNHENISTPVGTGSALIIPVSSLQDDSKSPPAKPLKSEGWSAEDIALRRFMALVAWGSGMHVLKHNRRGGKVRRLVKFDVKGGYLTWSRTMPAYRKTRTSAQVLVSAKRKGQLVILAIRGQEDVGFWCSRLTDAIVLSAGLAGIIRACKV